MASVEDLIDELFSDDDIKNTLRKPNNRIARNAHERKESVESVKMHDWDVDSDENGSDQIEIERKLRREKEKSGSRSLGQEASRIANSADAHNERFISNDDEKEKRSLHFDSDSDNDNCRSNCSITQLNGNLTNYNRSLSDSSNTNTNANIITHDRALTRATSHEHQSPKHATSWVSEEQRLQESEQEQRYQHHHNQQSRHELTHSRDDAYAALFTVPFPPAPPESVSTSSKCVNRCFVTSISALSSSESSSLSSSEYRHPTLAQLRALLTSTRATYTKRSDRDRLLERGAFYAVYPRRGNGCQERTMIDADEPGGCPFILCLRCNYGVIRLQDAEWQDDNGAINLYLTTRNYYPDWSRLASTSAVGVEHLSDSCTSSNRNVNNSGNTGESSERYVLKQSTQCAAYCCQCSWLTVKCQRASIETKLTDAIAFKQDEADLTNEHSLFATVLPLLTHETRRLPLWVCRGHNTFM